MGCCLSYKLLSKAKKIFKIYTVEFCILTDLVAEVGSERLLMALGQKKLRHGTCKSFRVLFLAISEGHGKFLSVLSSRYNWVSSPGQVSLS